MNTDRRSRGCATGSARCRRRRVKPSANTPRRRSRRSANTLRRRARRIDEYATQRARHGERIRRHQRRRRPRIASRRMPQRHRRGATHNAPMTGCRRIRSRPAPSRMWQSARRSAWRAPQPTTTRIRRWAKRAIRRWLKAREHLQRHPGRRMWATRSSRVCRGRGGREPEREYGRRAAADGAGVMSCPRDVYDETWAPQIAAPAAPAPLIRSPPVRPEPRAVQACRWGSGRIGACQSEAVSIEREELNGVHEFVLRIDGEHLGFLEWKPARGRRDAHRVQSKSLRSSAAASWLEQLVEKAVAFAKEPSLGWFPICSYARAVMRRDPALAALL